MKWAPVPSCLACPLSVVHYGDYTIVACAGEDPNDPNIVSCDINNVNIPKWCPLLSTQQLIDLVREEMRVQKANKKECD